MSNEDSETVLISEEDLEHPFSKLTSGFWGIYIPVPSSYLCCQIWSYFWSKYRFLRRLITIYIYVLCYFSIILPIVSIFANITCYTDMLHAIIAIGNIAGIIFIFAVINSISKGRFGLTMSTLNHPLSGTIISLIVNFKLTDDPKHNPKFEKFFFGCRFLTLASAFLTVVPLLNTNIWPYMEKVKSPPVGLLITDFVGTIIRIYHYQLFWIICYGVRRIIENKMQEITNQMENIGKDPDATKVSEGDEETLVQGDCVLQMEEAEKNLMDVRKLCTEILELVSFIDGKICWSIFLGIIETMCGIAAPFFIYVNALHTHTTLEERFVTHIVYLPWIIIRFFIFAYGFLCATRIPNSYNKSTARYKIAVHKLLSAKKWRNVDESFTKRELLDVQPCFTIAGFMNMKISALAILSFGQMLLGFDIIATINHSIVHQNITTLMDYYLPRCEYDSQLKAIAASNETAFL